MFIGLPTLYGSWLMPIYGHTQHAGLAENVLDHRLNCRTVYMNPINRYLYWNMNYHVEHHMFPLVPYHNLPRLHELVKADMPTPYGSIWEAWREIIPAVLRQVKDPAYHVKRKLPTPTIRADAPATAHIFTAKGQPVNGWIEVCASELPEEGRRHPLRPRAEDLRHLPHGRRRALRHRRHLHPRQHPSGRRLGQRQAHRMPQAQRALRHHRRLAAAPAGLRGAQDLQGPRARRQNLPRPQFRRRLRPGAAAHHLPDSAW